MSALPLEPPTPARLKPEHVKPLAETVAALMVYTWRLHRTYRAAWYASVDRGQPDREAMYAMIGHETLLKEYRKLRRLARDRARQAGNRGC